MSDLSYADVSARLQQRWPEHKIEPTLDRVQRLVELLGDPQKAYPVVHLTGTNGKTSTARMIDTLLREAGLRTGRFTSPHLESVRERITLDGEPISENSSSTRTPRSRRTWTWSTPSRNIRCRSSR